MWINTPESKVIVKDLSKELIAEIAPEEIEFVDELLDDYYSNPNMHESKDNPLGFGSEVLVASTPVVAMALQAMFHFVVTEAWASTQKEGSEIIAKKIKSLFNPASQSQITESAQSDEPSQITESAQSNEPSQITEPVLGMNQEQLKKAKQLIKKEAMRGGMSAKKAEDLALKIVGRIVLTVK